MAHTTVLLSFSCILMPAFSKIMRSYLCNNTISLVFQIMEQLSKKSGADSALRSAFKTMKAEQSTEALAAGTGAEKRVGAQIKECAEKRGWKCCLSTKAEPIFLPKLDGIPADDAWCNKFREIDCVVVTPSGVILVEIKARMDALKKSQTAEVLKYMEYAQKCGSTVTFLIGVKDKRITHTFPLFESIPSTWCLSCCEEKLPSEDMYGSLDCRTAAIWNSRFLKQLFTEQSYMTHGTTRADFEQALNNAFVALEQEETHSETMSRLLEELEKKIKTRIEYVKKMITTETLFHVLNTEERLSRVLR